MGLGGILTNCKAHLLGSMYEHALAGLSDCALDGSLKVYSTFQDLVGFPLFHGFHNCSCGIVVCEEACFVFKVCNPLTSILIVQGKVGV